MHAFGHIDDGHQQRNVHQCREDPHEEANHQGSSRGADVVGLKRGAYYVITFHGDGEEGEDGGVGGQVLAIRYEVACRDNKVLNLLPILLPKELNCGLCITF